VDRIRENLAFRRHNEVSPAKSEVFPAERDWKNDLLPVQNEVYPLGTPLKNEVYPEDFRSRRTSLEGAKIWAAPVWDTG